MTLDCKPGLSQGLHTSSQEEALLGLAAASAQFDQLADEARAQMTNPFTALTFNQNVLQQAPMQPVHQGQQTTAPAWPASANPTAKFPSTRIPAPSPIAAPGPGSGSALAHALASTSSFDLKPPAGSQAPESSLLRVPSWPSALESAGQSNVPAGSTDDDDTPLLALSTYLQHLSPKASARAPGPSATPANTRAGVKTSHTPSHTPHSTPPGPPISPLLLLGQMLEERAFTSAADDSQLSTAMVLTAGSDSMQRLTRQMARPSSLAMSGTVSYAAGPALGAAFAISNRPQSCRSSLQMDPGYINRLALEAEGRPIGQARPGMVKSKSSVQLHQDVNVSQHPVAAPAAVAGSPAAPAQLFSVKQQLHNMQQGWQKSGSGFEHHHPVAAAPSVVRPFASNRPGSTSFDPPAAGASVPAWPQPAATSLHQPSSVNAGHQGFQPSAGHQASPRLSAPPAPAKMPAVYRQPYKQRYPTARSSSIEFGDANGRPLPVGAVVQYAAAQPVPAASNGVVRALPSLPSPVPSKASWPATAFADANADELAPFSPSDALTDPSSADTLEFQNMVASAMSTIPPAVRAAHGSGSGSSADQLGVAKVASIATQGSLQTVTVGDTVPYPHMLEAGKVLDTAFYASPWQGQQTPAMLGAAGAATGAALHQRSENKHGAGLVIGQQAHGQHWRRSLSSGLDSATAPRKSMHSVSRKSFQLASAGVEGTTPGDTPSSAAGNSPSLRKRLVHSSGTKSATAAASLASTAPASRQSDVGFPSVPMSHWLVAGLVATILLLLMMNATLLTMAAQAFSDPAKA